MLQVLKIKSNISLIHLSKECNYTENRQGEKKLKLFQH